MSKVVKDQKHFFNMAASKVPVRPFGQFLMDYINHEQYICFDWLADKKEILDYGCGNAESVDVFFEKHHGNKYKIYGVDIAEEAVKHAARKYPKNTFFTIKDNKIPQIKDNSLDGGYMIHVLHHAEGHQQIFQTISSKLKRGSKFFLNDLTSNNPFIRLGRFFFTLMPQRIQAKFSDDLVVDGQIPDKYKIDVQTIQTQLQNAGFKVVELGYGHLFFFLFCWVDRFIPLSKIPMVTSLYKQLIRLERWMLNYRFFQNFAEVIYIQAIKK